MVCTLTDRLFSKSLIELNMSFKKADLYPCHPATARGEAARLSSSKDKVVYTNGRTVIVSAFVPYLYSVIASAELSYR